MGVEVVSVGVLVVVCVGSVTVVESVVELVPSDTELVELAVSDGITD